MWIINVFFFVSFYLFEIVGNTMLTPNFPTFSQYGPPTSPILAPASPRAHHSPIYQQPPQILYWGYPNQPMSPTTAYFGPLQIPPHAFTHFSPNLGDRPALVSFTIHYITLHLLFINHLSSPILIILLLVSYFLSLSDFLLNFSSSLIKIYLVIVFSHFIICWSSNFFWSTNSPPPHTSLLLQKCFAFF